MLTTRALMPSAFSFSEASTQRETSLPVPMKMMSGLPPGASGRIYAPLATPETARKFSAIESRHRLTRQNQRCRTMLLLHHDLPGFDDFIGIAGTQHQHVRHGAQRGQLLDRFMRRAVFADADGVVRHDVNRRKLHQRRQPHGWAHVVGEVEECRAEGVDAAETIMPFVAAAMACSRTPKWRLRPP